MIACRVLGFEIDEHLCRSCSMCETPADLGLTTTAPALETGTIVPLTKTPAGKEKGKPCQCGKMFTPASNRQERCPECAEIENAKQNRDRQIRYRERHVTG
jgi:hypothetical protein